MIQTHDDNLLLLAYDCVPPCLQYVDLLKLDGLLHQLTVAPPWSGPADYFRAATAPVGPVPWRRLDMVEHPMLRDSIQAHYPPAQFRVRKAAAWALEQAFGRGIIQLVHGNRELLRLKSNQLPAVAFVRVHAVPTFGSHLLKESSSAFGVLETTIRYDDGENSQSWRQATMAMPLAGFFEAVEYGPCQHGFLTVSRPMRRYQQQSQDEGAIIYVGFVGIEPDSPRTLKLTPITVGWYT